MKIAFWVISFVVLLLAVFCGYKVWDREPRHAPFKAKLISVLFSQLPRFPFLGRFMNRMLAKQVPTSSETVDYFHITKTRYEGSGEVESLFGVYAPTGLLSQAVVDGRLQFSDRSAFRVIVWFHPGGFQVGHANQEKDLALLMVDRFADLAEKPAVVVVPSYRKRFEPGVKIFDEIVNDAIFALDFVKSTFGDTEKVYVGGHSAGGLLAILLLEHVRDAQYALYPKHLLAGIIAYAPTNHPDPDSLASVQQFGAKGIMVTKQADREIIHQFDEEFTYDMWRDLEDLPDRFFVVTAKFCYYRDHLRYFVEKVREAATSSGAEIEVRHVEYDELHGFLNPIVNMQGGVVSMTKFVNDVIQFCDDDGGK